MLFISKVIHFIIQLAEEKTRMQGNPKNNILILNSWIPGVRGRVKVDQSGLYP